MSHPALIEHLQTHSVRRGDFVLKSGKRSDWFIDSKQTACRGDGMLLVAEAALSVMPDDVTAIGGLTMGADAAATAWPTLMRQMRPIAPASAMLV